MRFINWVLPIETPAVGMMPARLRPLRAVDDLLGHPRRPHRCAGIPVVDSPVGHGHGLRQRAVLAAEQHVVSPLLTADTAVAVGVAECHQHLAVRGIAVVPHDPEVGTGDGEPVDGLVRAVRSGHPADERGPGWRRWWCGGSGRAGPACRSAPTANSPCPVRGRAQHRSACCSSRPGWGDTASSIARENWPSPGQWGVVIGACRPVPRGRNVGAGQGGRRGAAGSRWRLGCRRSPGAGFGGRGRGDADRQCQSDDGCGRHGYVEPYRRRSDMSHLSRGGTPR